MIDLNRTLICILWSGVRYWISVDYDNLERFKADVNTYKALI